MHRIDFLDLVLVFSIVLMAVLLISNWSEKQEVNKQLKVKTLRQYLTEDNSNE